MFIVYMITRAVKGADFKCQCVMLHGFESHIMYQRGIVGLSVKEVVNQIGHARLLKSVRVWHTPHFLKKLYGIIDNGLSARLESAFCL